MDLNRKTCASWKLFPLYSYILLFIWQYIILNRFFFKLFSRILKRVRRKIKICCRGNRQEMTSNYKCISWLLKKWDTFLVSIYIYLDLTCFDKFKFHQICDILFHQFLSMSLTHVIDWCWFFDVWNINPLQSQHPIYHKMV